MCVWERERERERERKRERIDHKWIGIWYFGLYFIYLCSTSVLKSMVFLWTLMMSRVFSASGLYSDYYFVRSVIFLNSRVCRGWDVFISIYILCVHVLRFTYVHEQLVAFFFFSFWGEYIYHHHHHHVVRPARISLTLSLHVSLSFIASGRSLGLHPVSSHSCCMYVRAGCPAFDWPYAGVHRSTSLTSSSLFL